jgi:hypothetical protein
MSNDLTTKLAKLLVLYNNLTTTYEQDAEAIIKGLKADGYNISSNNINSDKAMTWCDAINSTVKGWSIVIYKHYNLQSNDFEYSPQLVMNYNCEDDLIKGGKRAHLLCEITLPV